MKKIIECPLTSIWYDGTQYYPGYMYPNAHGWTEGDLLRWAVECVQWDGVFITTARRVLDHFGKEAVAVAILESL